VAKERDLERKRNSMVHSIHGSLGHGTIAQ